MYRSSDDDQNVFTRLSNPQFNTSGNGSRHSAPTLSCNKPGFVSASRHRTSNLKETPMHAGFLGIGNMGLPMAGKLLDGGHNLTVYDIRETAMQPLLERQARRAPSPRD